MTVPQVRMFDSLPAQLLRVIFGLYLIVAILVTAVQLSAEYFHVKDSVTQELKKCRQSSDLESLIQFGDSMRNC